MMLLNGKPMDESAATISPLAPGFMFGAGVFTTVRVRAGGVEFMALHAERLANDARALGLEPVSGVDALRARCEVCISAKIVWFADENQRTSEVICQRPHAYSADTFARGLRLMTLGCGPRANRELSRHKTLNYLEHLRGKRAAVSAGFDEGLWVDDKGTVLEGATCNIFAVLDGEIVTPAVTAGLLPGVARRVVLTLKGLVPVRETTLTTTMLATAQEVFVTNALMGVASVCAVDERAYDVDRNSVMRTVRAAFERHAAEAP
jgi:branched-subunit amino acid aminotransferase/4-amino-4-deoxychorismate lyase